MADLAPGDVLWVAPDPTVGREQSSRRPAVLISGIDYLNTVETLAIVVPVTSVDRAGRVDASTVHELRGWVGDFLDL